jgi:hypothetical protein
MVGVYYLWDGSEVLYIGASVNVERRIAQHASSGLDFAGYFCDQCAADELQDRESAAIREFRPALNERMTTIRADQTGGRGSRGRCEGRLRRPMAGAQNF